jgi:hypothetical protein
MREWPSRRATLLAKGSPRVGTRAEQRRHGRGQGILDRKTGLVDDQRRDGRRPIARQNPDRQQQLSAIGQAGRKAIDKAVSWGRVERFGRHDVLPELMRFKGQRAGLSLLVASK